MLQRLPLAVRFQIQEQIIAEQRSMLTTMDPMKYQQYLQSVFPQGVPANIGEMYQGMAQGTAEMYKGVLAGIETTKAPETVQNTLQIDKSKATGAALKAKELTELLT